MIKWSPGQYNDHMSTDLQNETQITYHLDWACLLFCFFCAGLAGICLMSVFSRGRCHGLSRVLLIGCLGCFASVLNLRSWNFTHHLSTGDRGRLRTARHASRGFLLFNSEATSKEKFMLSKLFPLVKEEMPEEFKALDWQPQDSRGTRYFNAMDNKCVEYIAAGRKESWSEAAQRDFKSKGSRFLQGKSLRFSVLRFLRGIDSKSPGSVQGFKGRAGGIHGFA